MPELTIINGDTKSNVDTAREHAEKLINDGAQLLIGAFNSGQTTAVAQVAEQKGIPLVINVASATQITEQGYKFVVRNFPTAPMLLNDELSSQKDIFALAGVAQDGGVHARQRFVRRPDVAGRPQDDAGLQSSLHHRRRDFLRSSGAQPSVEVTKAKATNAEIMVVVGQPNDAMLLTREMIKQRWTPQAILSMGPGWYENQYTKTLGKMSDGPLSLVPWYDPNKKLSQMLEAALAKAYPDFNLNTNHVFTFEALLVAADAYKRAGSADPRRWPKRCTRPTSPTTRPSGPASSSTPRVRIPG